MASMLLVADSVLMTFHFVTVPLVGLDTVAVGAMMDSRNSRCARHCCKGIFSERFFVPREA